ncbi:hypothetical protein G6F62_005174 [Rhizopus arrhizus]|nr:hypothetical protein G6F62_005174 [Rhizopus arrhizus]
MQKQLECKQGQALSYTASYNTLMIKTVLLSTPQKIEASSSAPPCKPKDLQSLGLDHYKSQTLARFEKRLTKTQVEKTIEEDSALDSVRNLSITQDEVGAGHQEDTSLSMEEEKEEVSLSPNKEASRLQHQPQTTTSKTTIVQTNIDNSTTTNGESAASTSPTLQYPERRNTTTRRSLTQFHNNWIL